MRLFEKALVVSFSSLAALFGEVEKRPSIVRGREQTMASVSQTFLKIRLISSVLKIRFLRPYPDLLIHIFPRIGWAICILTNTFVASYHQESVGTHT